MRERMPSPASGIAKWNGSPEPLGAADGSGEPLPVTCRNLTAAILAGGLGTRLRPALNSIPKVLAPVNGRPFITFLLNQLARAGIARAVLLTGYQADQVFRALGDRYGGVALSYSVETSPLGTAGALRHALAEFKTDSVLLLNGDSYCDVDLSRMAATHRCSHAEMTMALIRVANTQRFGRVETTANGKITHFGEKPMDAGHGWINGGVYVLARSLIAEISAKRELSLERDLLPEWVNSKRCRGYKTSGRFLDIGTPSSYAAATFFFRR